MFFLMIKMSGGHVLAARAGTRNNGFHDLRCAVADLKTQLTEGEKALAAFRKTASAA